MYAVCQLATCGLVQVQAEDQDENRKVLSSLCSMSYCLVLTLALVFTTLIHPWLRWVLGISLPALLTPMVMVLILMIIPSFRSADSHLLLSCLLRMHIFLGGLLMYTSLAGLV